MSDPIRLRGDQELFHLAHLQGVERLLRPDDAKAAGAATKDLDSFKENYANVMRNCGGCHETYRIKKS